MKTINEQIEGDLRLTEDLMLNGQVTGSLTVTAGTELILNGQVGEDLIVEKGGIATINGMVCGRLISYGESGGGGMVIGGVEQH